VKIWRVLGFYLYIKPGKSDKEYQKKSEYQKRIEKSFFVQTEQPFKVTYIFSIFFKLPQFVMTSPSSTIGYWVWFFTSVMGGYLHTKFEIFSNLELCPPPGWINFTEIYFCSL